MKDATADIKTTEDAVGEPYADCFEHKLGFTCTTEASGSPLCFGREFIHETQ